MIKSIVNRCFLFAQNRLSVLTRALLGPHVRALVVQASTGVFAVHADDYGVGRRLRMTGSYGVNEIERIRPLLDTRSDVLVVGAHVGTLAIPLAKCCRDVVAIEANPDTYQLLKLNVHLNDATNCSIFNIAASDKREQIDFLLNRANSGGSKRVPRIDDRMYRYDDPKTIKVDAVPLDELLSGREFRVVVMDIEGSEYFALRGMQEILKRNHALIVEFVPHHLRNVSGVTVREFLSTIEPHFSKLAIPSRGVELRREEFLGYLQSMYDADQGDDGIVFEKAP